MTVEILWECATDSGNCQHVLKPQRLPQGPYGPGNEPEVEVNEKKTVKVTYTYLMPTTPLSECRLSYEVFGDGRVKTTLSYDPVKELGDMPEFGVIFQIQCRL